jgi:acetyl-CoA acetyltransferase
MVSIASFTSKVVAKSDEDEVELLVPVIREAIAKAGLTKKDIGFTVSGSCDYLGGRPFSFVMALDAVGAWPPIAESHVEMDGAWAMYEAWVRLHHGDIDAALIYAFGRSSQGDLKRVVAQQFDPYLVGPLGIDWFQVEALQARALLDAGKVTERRMAEIASATENVPVEELLARPYVAAPLREHDCHKTLDGAAAMVLVRGDRGARIKAMDHRIEGHSVGARDLTRSASTARAREKVGGADVAFVHAPFTHQVPLLEEALGAKADRGTGDPFIVGGLARIGAAANAILEGKTNKALAHATSGPCLQQNLVCLLEGS